MTLDDWYEFATTDADRRDLPELRPLLKGLHLTAAALRAAEWNDDARGQEASTADVTASQPPQPPNQSQPSQSSQSSQSSQPSPRASS